MFFARISFLPSSHLRKWARLGGQPRTYLSTYPSHFTSLGNIRQQTNYSESLSFSKPQPSVSTRPRTRQACRRHLALPYNRIMSSDSDKQPPPMSQKVVGAIFFIMPVAFIAVFACWCWRRNQRSREGRWANLIYVVTPHNTSLDSLPTAPELHSVHLQLDDGGVNLRWSDIKVRGHNPICSSDSESNIIYCHEPVYASSLIKSLSGQPESSSGTTAQVGVLVRMPSREPINTSESAHLRGLILLGSTICTL